jgi:hypothetical protein
MARKMISMVRVIDTSFSERQRCVPRTGITKWIASPAIAEA